MYIWEEPQISPTLHPLDEVKWERRDIQLINAEGEVIFEQLNVECPSSWSDRACRIAVHKYFFGNLGEPDRECSIRYMIERVVKAIVDWGQEQGYFSGAVTAAFQADLQYILVNQIAAFNTPVWINVGTTPTPQASACFILSLEDSLKSIERLDTVSMEVFRRGSGVGTNLSSLRERGAPLSGGGFAAGPIPFAKGLDFMGGAMKSGGRQRRGGKMLIMDSDHPDVNTFIGLKVHAEQIAHTLIAAGFDPDWDTGIYNDIPWQNANHTIRVPDEFMKRVVADQSWPLISRKTGEVVKEVSAKELWSHICEAAWSCGCPGLQFSDTINKWHTCKSDGEIIASNPCSEFMFLDDTSCNLASIHLSKFWRKDIGFDVTLFERVARIVFTAMDILVDKVYYPDPEITERTKEYRPLGLGYSDLGGLLMRCGIPYDSEEGRSIAAGITSLMHATAADQSCLIARALGPFKGYERNKGHVEEVMVRHWEALDNTPFGSQYPHPKIGTALNDMGRRADELLSNVAGKPMRNAQLTLLAPCGTIALLMDCDTMGIEPDLGLVKHKQLVGGSYEKIVNETIQVALQTLGYGEQDIGRIKDHIHKTGTVVGSKVQEEHYAVFDTAMDKDRPISWQGHVLMMAAVQPFLSGAISKTVDMPRDATVEDVDTVFRLAFREALKSITIYRDGSKGGQPVTVGVGTKKGHMHRKLPDECEGKRVKFNIGGTEVFTHTGHFDDGELGEVFVTVGKSGSTIQGLFNCFCIAFSVGQQWGVPFAVITEKLRHQKFEPSGPVKLPGRERPRFYLSVIDCIFDWLSTKYATPEVQEILKAAAGDETICNSCGGIMRRSGNCFVCTMCGLTSGCS